MNPLAKGIPRKAGVLLVLLLHAVGHALRIGFGAESWFPTFKLSWYALILLVLFSVKGYRQMKREAALLLILGGALAHWILFQGNTSWASVGVAFRQIAVALNEEWVARVLLYDLFYRAGNKWPALWASLSFACMHLLNLSRMSLASVANQILVAFGFGYLFQSMLSRWRLLTLPTLVHLLVNVTLGKSITMNALPDRLEPLLIFPTCETLQGPFFVMLLLIFFGLLLRNRIFAAADPIQMNP